VSPAMVNFYDGLNFVYKPWEGNFLEPDGRKEESLGPTWCWPIRWARKKCWGEMSRGCGSKQRVCQCLFQVHF